MDGPLWKSHLFEAVRDRVLFLLPRHAKVRDLDDVSLADEAVAGGEVAVDAVLGLEVLHAGRRVQTHSCQNVQSCAKVTFNSKSRMKDASQNTMHGFDSENLRI